MRPNHIRQRIGEAVLKGWGFRFFKFCQRESGRHSVWISKPEQTDWYAEKVNVHKGDQQDNLKWVARLLDEAGVP